MGLGILAAEATKHLDLIGRLRGYFIVVFAVGLFCGSIFLLLSTNLGARLGFLIAFASLSGFLMLLGLIWFTNLTPLNALHGPPPHWVVKEVVDDPAQAKTEKARTIVVEGVPVEAAAQGEIKATVDSALTAEGGTFQKYSAPTDYVVINADKIGGGGESFFRHRALYSLMLVQGAKTVEVLPGGAPPAPAPDPAKPKHYVVLERDLGAMRLPPLVMSTAFALLFALSVYALHNLERAEQKAKAGLEPAPA
ncbi:MAG: hypothetical protein QOE80_2844 [Actinomycetota bacterium]|jgi:hypothetical protein|nr:hypothetical protein [Actinomycetota bacterium]